MREVRNCDDYGIACCVSYQAIGKQIQFLAMSTAVIKPVQAVFTSMQAQGCAPIRFCTRQAVLG